MHKEKGIISDLSGRGWVVRVDWKFERLWKKMPPYTERLEPCESVDEALMRADQVVIYKNIKGTS